MTDSTDTKASESQEDHSSAAILVQRKVEWSDTDASGHYHNSMVFRLCEVAETALFQELGLLEFVYGRIPRVHVTVDFHSVLHFADVVDVRLQVASVGKTSINYDVEIDRSGELCAKAKIVAVLVKPNGEPRPWPDDYKKALLTAGSLEPELLQTKNRSAAERFRDTPWSTREIPGDDL
ncbi:MAG: 2-aminobenzoate-CoA ligase [Actinomycetota bacterium]|nr:2-aminobenzoate-CoA ligase [Actinomycetota bacterium]